MEMEMKTRVQNFKEHFFPDGEGIKLLYGSG